ncbi:MAG: DMT family transporter [Paracoccaceae bacterium]
MPAESATRQENLRGAVYMVVAMAAFVINDTIMKSLSDEIPIFQAVLVRGIFASVLIGALACWRGVARVSALAPADRGYALLRALAEIGSTVCFLIALFNMPIANATAIMLSSPLLLTMIGALLLGERVGWRRWTAILIGFVGVLMIVKPGAEAFNDASLWAVGSVFFVCLRDIMTRKLSHATPSLVITLITAVAITAVGALVVAVEGWTPIDLEVVLSLLFSAVFVFFGYLFSVMTMRVGDMGFVSPFRYTNLIWALALGWLVFGDAPGVLTLFGAALVVATGVFTFYREGRPTR